MRSGFVSELLRLACLAAIAAAAAFLAAIALASPAAADPNSGGNGNRQTEKPWDTDNLRYSTYSARNFRVPFHEYAGYASFSFTENTTFQARAREACQSAIADGFFQTGGSVGAKNDFPVLSKTAGSWGDSETGSRSSGCGDFVAKQHQAATGTTGFYLDIAGNLRNGLPERSVGNYSRRSGSYTHWIDTAAGRAYAHGFARAAARDSRIPLEVRPYGRQAYTATRSSTRSPAAGYVGIASPSDGYLARTDNYRSRVAVPQPSGGRWLPVEAAIDPRNEGVVWEATGSWPVVHLSSASGARFLSSSQDIGGDSGTAFCPAGMHPRGQDGLHVIGGGTGRTLSAINTMGEVRNADRHWCRSDVRYKIDFKGQIHKKCDSNGRNPSATGTSECLPPAGVGDPRDGTFQAYGRINCYYTAIRLQVAADGSARCVYPHPLPQCTDPDSNRKRDWTRTELRYHTLGASFDANDDGSTSCDAKTPDTQGFNSAACVTVNLQIGENTPSGNSAAPGVAASHRTRTATQLTPAWDLGVAAGHSNTASPPRDTTGSDRDPSGCADGGESRGDHGAAGSAVRKNGQTSPPPASSLSSDSSHPPSGGGSSDVVSVYDGVRKNLAHRYASLIAENTCQVKKAEAEAYLQLLKNRARTFSGTLPTSFARRYRDTARRYEVEYRNYKNNLKDTSVHPSSYPASHPYPNGHYKAWYNTNRPLRIAYAEGKETAWANLKDAIETARVAHKTATDAAALVDYSSGSCVDHWDGEMERLEGLFSDTEDGGAGKAFFDAIKPFETAAKDTEDINRKPVISGSTKKPKATPAQTNTLLSRGQIVYGTETLCSNGGSPDEDGSCTKRNVCPVLASCPPTSTYTSTGNTFIPADQEGTHSAVKTTTIRYNGNSRTVSTSCTGLTARDYYPASAPGFLGASTIIIPFRWTGWNYSDCAHSEQNTRRISEIIGTPQSLPDPPSVKAVPAVSPPAQMSFDRLRVLLTYHPQSPARAGLEASLGSERSSAAVSLRLRAEYQNYVVPAQKVRDWRDAYVTAYLSANSAALADLGGDSPSAWRNLAWGYHDLGWWNYVEDPAVTYSDSSANPRDGTGCDIFQVSTAGKVSVRSSRLDYETSSYGNGNVYGPRSEGQRTCKIKRTRSPSLEMEYRGTGTSGTDTTKTGPFWHVNYQPDSSDGRHLLPAETEVFAVRAALADRPPVLCHTTFPAGGLLISNKAATGQTLYKAPPEAC